jgi:Secretion system C-terminal sorting domain
MMKFTPSFPARMLMLLLLLNSTLAAVAQTITGTPVTAGMPVTLTVAELEKRANNIVRQNVVKIREELNTKKIRRPQQSPNALQTASYPKGSNNPVLAQQNTQAIHSNFAALQTYETSGVVVTPPDCMGDVGPTQVCIASNNRLKWYSKPTVCDAPLTTSTSSGALALSGATFSIYIEDFFASVSNGSEVTDPHVHYDRLSQRWFIVAINTAASSNRIMIAVSNGPTISNLSSFSFYQFAHDTDASIGSSDRAQFCDYPTLGVDKHALYIGGLIFNATSGDYIGSSVYVVRKSSLTSGGPLVFTPFRGQGTTSGGIFCPQGVHNDDPNADRGYYLGVSAEFYGVLNYIVVNNPGTIPAITTGTISVPATSFPIEVPALNSTNDLDAGDDRLLNAVLVRNKNSNSSAIWASHSIGVTNTGVASTTSPTRVATRWYAVNVNGSTLTLNQSGTLFDNAAFGPINYWMGGIAATGQGHALLGATQAGVNAAPNAVIAGRYNSTTPGSLFAPVQVTSYNEAYNLQTGETQRWGDYSQTVTDPSDDMTMWTFQQFVSGTDRWAVRATQIKAPPPAAVSNMTAVTCTGDRTINITLNGTAGANFAGYYDPGADANGPGYARRLAVSSTGGVVISNLNYVNPTQLSFTLNYASATLGSQQTLTITNPDCQSVTFNYTLPTGCNPLPVSWVSVDAVWVNAKAVVKWKVTNEVNLKEYVVERSSDGRQYTAIGTVKENAALNGQYQFTDEQPGAENYYRIRQVDIDGAMSYSGSVLLRKAAAISKLGVYPNPAREAVRLTLPAASGTVRLLDVKGTVLYSSKVAGNLLDLPVASYPRGVYVVEFVSAAGKAEQEKLILK